jgi:hypothetical protein
MTTDCFSLNLVNTTRLNTASIDIEEHHVYRQVIQAQRVRNWNRQHPSSSRRKKTRTIAIQTGYEVTESDIAMSENRQSTSYGPSISSSQLDKSIVEEMFTILKCYH